MTQTSTVRYLPGGGRAVETKNGYNALWYVDVFEPGGRQTRTWRSGASHVDGCSAIQREWDADRRTQLERCLGTEGQIVVGSSGCFARRRGYSPSGDLEFTACLQDDLAPMHDKEGVHRTTYVVDGFGRPIEEMYHATTGERVPRWTDGCVRRRFKRDDRGNIEAETCLDLSGNPVREQGAKHATTRFTRDANGCIIERSFFDVDGNATRDPRHRLRSDPQCSMLAFELRDAGGSLKGIAWELELTRDRQEAVKRCRDASGPAQCPLAGYYESGPRGSQLRLEYDERGREIRRRCFYSEGKPSRCSGSYPHETRLAYAEDGRSLSHRYFDEFGKATTALGAARDDILLDAVGNMTSVRSYDGDGAPMVDRCGCFELLARYDAKQRLTSMECRGTGGEPRARLATCALDGTYWPPGAARVELDRDPTGKLSNVYYGTTGSRIKTVPCTDVKADCYR